MYGMETGESWSEYLKGENPLILSFNVNVIVDSNPDSSTIERIKKLIAKKRALFEFQKSLFN